MDNSSSPWVRGTSSNRHRSFAGYKHTLPKVSTEDHQEKRRRYAKSVPNAFLAIPHSPVASSPRSSRRDDIFRASRQDRETVRQEFQLQQVLSQRLRSLEELQERLYMTRRWNEALEEERVRREARRSPSSARPSPQLTTTLLEPHSSTRNGLSIRAGVVESLSPSRMVPFVTVRTPSHRSVSVPMSVPSDKLCLSPYQVVLRESIEFFEAVPGGDYGCYHKHVAPRRVGIRCVYCAHLPAPWREKGCAYFPGKIGGVYQAAQNMAKNHLLTQCKYVPMKVRQKMQEERGKSKRRGGAQHWAASCRRLGLQERVEGIYFRDA